ncbi:MAG: RecX family transcriptional regulator [Bacilli bacterium]|nr:RecX family transcriptional regulator [Bacilli bacterium]
MKIDKIKKLPSGKYKIMLDNNSSIVTYDDVLIKNRLLFDKSIDSKKYEVINTDTNYYNIYNKIIKMISNRMRSVKQITDYLISTELSKVEQDEILSKLKDIGLLDDVRFAKAYVSDRLYLSNNGPDKIKSELLDLGISMDIVLNELSKIDSNILYDKLKRIISNKVKNNHKHSNYMLKQKLLISLVNNGFSRDMIIDVFESYVDNSSDIINSEFSKLYNKLSRKFEGNDLYRKIKEKLFQKGFDSASINGVIEKNKNF